MSLGAFRLFRRGIRGWLDSGGWGGESGVSGVAQVWYSHRGYSGIPCIFCKQNDFLEPCRQVLEESQRGQGQRKLMINLA